MDSHQSRSEKKRRAKGVEELVIELAALPQSQINILPCSQEVRDEIASARDLKGGARKRQLKYATKLLRDKPLDELYDFLARNKGSRLKEKREFHELEHLRNLLIDEAIERYEALKLAGDYLNENEPVGFLENSRAIEVIMAQIPDVDQVLLKNTAMQFARTRNRKFSRELFRIMQAAVDKARFSQKQESK